MIFQDLSLTQCVLRAAQHFGVVGGLTAGVEDGDYLHTPSLWFVMVWRSGTIQSITRSLFMLSGS